MRHASWPRTEEAKPPRAERVTAQRLRALLHFRPDQRVKGRTVMQAACNRTKGAHPFDFDASSMEAQAHTSCNRRAGYYVRKTAPPLALVPLLLDCGTGAATRGNPAHGPTVPTRRIGHRSVRRGRRRDGRYGQKWAGSDDSGRRAEAAVKSSAGSRPLLGQRENPLPRREDDAPVFRSSNGSRTHNGCPANHSSRRVNSAAGQATPLAGDTFGRRSGRHFTSAIMTASKKRCTTSFNFISFSSSPFSLLLQGLGKGILRKGSFSVKEAGPEPPTDQRFKGWSLRRVRLPPQSTWAPRPLLVRGSKAGPSEGFDSRLRPLGLRAHY
jgi:hypothetical protein